MAAPLLLAIDFSPASRAAAEAARALAADLKAPVVALHVLDAWEWSEEVGSPSREARVAEAARSCSEWVQGLRDAGVEVEVVCRPGVPADAILEEAQARGCPLVVMGTAGKAGLRRWLLGSVAQEVLRRASLPVLVVPTRMAAAGRPHQPSGKRVLVATDFSAGGEAAFEAGLRLARDLRAPLRLLHVVEIPFATAAYPFPEAVTAPAAVAQDEEHAMAQLAVLASRARGMSVAATPSVQVGHVPSAVLAEAREGGAALIVVGTHGRSGLRRFVLGSQSQALVQMADRPVLVVPDRMAGAAGAWMR